MEEDHGLHDVDLRRQLATMECGPAAERECTLAVDRVFDGIDTMLRHYESHAQSLSAGMSR